MNKDLWQKACAFLLVLLLSLAGWGLWKVDQVDERTARMEERMLIWHTGAGSNATAIFASKYQMRMTCDQRLEFSQRSMVRAYNSIKAHGYDSALKALLIGLEDSGWVCREEAERLQCNKGG